MRILLTNITLAGRSGTETVTRDLAFGYLRAGHSPVVYTRTLGPIAEEIRARAIPVTDSIDDISGDIDVIHGHHLNACVAALVKFDRAPAISVLHDFTTWYDLPPRLPSVRRYVAISDGFADRLTGEAGVDPAAVRVVLNGVDTRRFLPGPPLNEKPKRALAFAKNLGHVQAVAEACRLRDIEVDFIGGLAGPLVDAPESLMAQYDLVFGSARSAIEALACRRAVVVCDGRGMGGMVDRETYAPWRRENFGLRILSHPVTVETCLEAIDRYDPETAMAVGDTLRADANLEAWSAAYLDVLHEAVAEGAPVRQGAELARHLEIWTPQLSKAWPWAIERQELLDERNAALSGLLPLPVGRAVEFASDSPHWRRYVRLAGFHAPEDGGAWSRVATAEIRALVPAGAENSVLDIDYYAVPFATESVTLEVVVNGRHVFDGPVTLEADGRIGIALAGLVESDGTLWCALRVSRVFNPLRLGISADDRDLGIGLARMALRDAADQ